MPTCKSVIFPESTDPVTSAERSSVPAIVVLKSKPATKNNAVSAYSYTTLNDTRGRYGPAVTPKLLILGGIIVPTAATPTWIVASRLTSMLASTPA